MSTNKDTASGSPKEAQQDMNSVALEDTDWKSTTCLNAKFPFKAGNGGKGN